jgi:hypothetical protein
VVVVIDLVEKTSVEGAYGTAMTNKGLCKVEILKDRYPDCITHEIMHCFSGNWHEGYDTTRYCNAQ